jgi:hypothetical protein
VVVTKQPPRDTPSVPGRGPRLGPRWEDAVEKSIRESMARGEFDRLPGKGKPIDGLDGPHDELWWVKDKLRREELAALPPSLAVRRDRDDLLEALPNFRTERAVRDAVEELNERIRKLNRYGSPSGPPTSLMPQDVEAIVERWRAATT